MEANKKNIVITGGGRGIGRQFATDFQKLGSRPFVIDVGGKDLDDLKKKNDIPVKIVDVTKENEVETFFEEYTADYGPPDVLINNAGITADGLLIRKSGENIKKFSLSSWNKVVGVNLTGVFLCTREAVVQMVKHDVKGVIINISSISRAGNFGQTNYSATKAGVAAMTVTWAKELSRYGIRVAAIAPGYVNTEMVSRINKRIIDGIVDKILVGRLGEMEEISRAARFILECDYFNGRTLEVDGGHRI